MNSNVLRKTKRQSTLGFHLFSLPAVVLSSVVVIIPALQTIYSAFTKWNGISPVKQWIGLQNFTELVNDWVFWKAISNNVTWMLWFVTIPVLIAMVASMLMVRFRIGYKTFQSIYLIPYLLAPTTNAIIWLNVIFSPVAGIVGFLQKAGININSPLSNINTALF
ncbi:MAG: sugar ABC transporter permease, partial [Christensenellaceae bacterium]|nr:sugar ABC transporter permease [Christensenellaceae bacterium]